MRNAETGCYVVFLEDVVAVIPDLVGGVVAREGRGEEIAGTGEC